jgi:O-antigen ligase
MDFTALIDFNKYTLALAAACIAYSLEKFVPMPTPAGRYLVLVLLAIFMLSALCAVLLFAVATAALHRDKDNAAKLKPLIGRLGIAQMAFLCIGLVVLGGMLADRVLTEPQAPTPVCCVKERAN